MPIDIEDIKLEELYWSCTSRLRWFRPPGGSDNDLQLQQLWERVTGERAWRIVPTCLAD
jgi:hypothetical protein